MSVRIRWFAALRERRAREEELVELVPGTTVGELYAKVSPIPGLPVALVVNRALVPASTPLQDGDEVAFLPPLGGG